MPGPHKAFTDHHGMADVGNVANEEPQGRVVDRIRLFLTVMNGGKDFSEWSRKDDFLYKMIRVPVEAILGRDGVGLPDAVVAESKFEKGEDISARMLALVPRLSEELTPAELLILHLICADKSNAQIAEILDIKLPTVKTHVSHILAKLDVNRRSEAKTAAKRLHLVSGE